MVVKINVPVWTCCKSAKKPAPAEFPGSESVVCPVWWAVYWAGSVPLHSWPWQERNVQRCSSALPLLWLRDSVARELLPVVGGPLGSRSRGSGRPEGALGLLCCVGEQTQGSSHWRGHVVTPSVSEELQVSCRKPFVTFKCVLDYSGALKKKKIISCPVFWFVVGAFLWFLGFYLVLGGFLCVGLWGGFFCVCLVFCLFVYLGFFCYGW